MPFALKLFKINVYHTYYSSQVTNDLYMIPDVPTQQLMDYHRMRLAAYDGTYELIWLTAKLENPFEVFQKKLASTALNFYLKLRNPHVVNFSSLKFEQTAIYYFSNAYNSQDLHKGAYVGEEDKIPLQTSINNTDKAFPNAFGIVNIQLGKVWKDKAELEQLPTQYNIQIQAREAIWRYHIVDLHKRIKSPMKIVVRSS